MNRARAIKSSPNDRDPIPTLIIPIYRPDFFFLSGCGSYDGDVGEYDGDVGEYDGDVGEYAALAPPPVGDVGLYDGDVGEYDAPAPPLRALGDVGL